jgi:putative transposase
VSGSEYPRVGKGIRVQSAHGLLPENSAEMRQSPSPERRWAMKGSRFSEEQIIGVLREHEAGARTEEVCRRHGISSATFYIYGRLPRGKKVRVLVWQ